MKAVLRIVVAALAWSIALSAVAEVTASLDRDQVELGDSVQLTLARDSRAGGLPDLAPLKHDFDVLDTSSGSSIQIVNGHMSTQVQAVIVLAPKHEGKISIPRLQWDGEQSPALDLTVTAGGASGRSNGSTAASSAPAHVFLTATPDSTQPYVQGTVVLTVRLHTDRQLYQPSLDLPDNDAVSVQLFGKARQGSETRDGYRYQVIEQKYLVVPQHSGEITLEGPVLSAQIEDSRTDPFSSDPFFGRAFGRMPLAHMFNSTRPLRLHADPIVLKVRPRPAGWSGRDWLPARTLTLDGSWHPDSAQVHAGEPVTLHLHLAADGLMGTQLPDLSKLLDLPDGVKAYPDQAKSDTAAQGNSIIGSRDQDIALIADKPGRYELPALHLPWWDTEKDVQREAVLPARTLEILPAAAANNAVVAASPPAAVSSAASPAPALAPAASAASDRAASSSSVLRWQGIALAFAALWLATLAAWWWRARRPAAGAPASAAVAEANANPHARDALKAFQRACRDDDAPAARRALLAWGQATWLQESPAGLNALARRLNNPELMSLLRELDRVCYAGGVWRGEALLRTFKTPPVPEKPASNGSVLGGLYPEPIDG